MDVAGLSEAVATALLRHGPRAPEVPAGAARRGAERGLQPRAGPAQNRYIADCATGDSVGFRPWSGSRALRGQGSGERWRV